MLKQIAVAMALGLVCAAASAQTVRLPGQQPPAQAMLVKHDGKHDNGRHLGWYKHQGEDADEDDDNRRGRNRMNAMPYGYAPPGYYQRGPYNGFGYGSSYPPPLYGPPY